VELDLPDLLDSIAERITALDATAYEQGDSVQGGYGLDGWTETSIPTTAIDGGSPVGHLQFVLVPVGSSNTDLDNDRPAGSVYTRTGLRLMYGYHLRTGSPSQVTDERLSMHAARDLRHALLDEWPGDRIVYLVDAYSSMITPDGEWLLVTIALDIFHDLPI